MALSLINQFNVTDDATLRLDRAFSVTTAVVGGTTYLFAAGDLDSGISVFSVAADGADFTNLIRQSADMADRSELRRTRVKGETWEARAADIEAALAQL